MHNCDSHKMSFRVTLRLLRLAIGSGNVSGSEIEKAKEKFVDAAKILLLWSEWLGSKDKNL